jgi:tetratricopeptide (TPR) repeat protein
MGNITAASVLALCVSAATPALAQMMGGYGGMGGMGGTGDMSIAIKPDDFTLALRDIQKEKYAEAIPLLERALRNRPHSADIMNLLGSANRMAGNYPLSLAWYKNALAEDPDHKRAHENLGDLYLSARDLASAQAQLAELARLCPDGCDERDTLARSVAAYQAAQPAATVAATPASAGAH